ncbi:unnamed protein product [Lasius platythorax]|uniref:Retrovirus-related Pol polyprotein from transposon TNT 1-94 n=1 Tax=Lasius platythorax TaxID=488582 RepID=A0AAV2MXI3_9HYME
MKGLGEAKSFLGLEIQQDKSKGEVKISQSRYIRKTIEKFGMADCKSVGTPADLNVKLEEEIFDSMEDTTKEENDAAFKDRYLEAVGSLLYIAQLTRPDIAKSVNAVSRFCKKPKNIHWTAVKRIFRYLKGTADFCLKYSRANKSKLLGFSDADWGNDKHDRRSISGCTFLLNGAAISWHSKKQRTTALSTVEAEYIALASTCQEAAWLENLVREMELNHEKCE